MSWGSPDFVGIGAQKAGTTWWYDLICEHPDVYRHAPFHKERQFLSAMGAGSGLGEDRLADYRSWFPRPPGTITGEWTPDYLYYHWVPQLLARVAPGARILVLLRDPVERFRSGLAHQAANGSGGQAAAAEEAYQRGLYSAQLARWEEYFGSDQILVLQYEKCRDEPSAQLARTYRFLGLRDDFLPDTLGKGPGPTKASPIGLSRSRAEMLRRLYEADVARLASRYAAIDLGRWRWFADMVAAPGDGRLTPAGEEVG